MIAHREDIRFECSQCGQPFVVDADGAGLETSCPVCQTRVTVPRIGALDDRDYGRRGLAPERSRSPEATEIARLRQELEAALEEGEKLNANAARADAELRQSRQELAAQKQKLLAAAEQTAARDREFSDTQAALAAARSEGEALRTDRSVRESELTGVRAELAQTEEELCGAQAELGKLREESARQRTSAEQAQTQWRSAEDSRQTLATRCEDLRKEAKSLRDELRASESGRELSELRGKVAALSDQCAKSAARLAKVEGEARTAAENARELRAELLKTQGARDEAQRRAEAASESQLQHDNEVLRGIVKRQNAELVQRLAELTRLRRARFAARMLYVLFALALLGAIVFAIRHLPAVLP